MALRSSNPGAEKVDIEELLDVVDKTMDRLKTLYEQYFLGLQKQAPTQIHTDVERRLRDLQQVNIRNTGLRYRFATLQQKFGSYNNYWRRTLRQIENGTYIRQLAKVGRQAALTGAEVPEEILAAMPQRMREQIKRDREQALAIQRRRSGDAGSDFDVDLDAAAEIGESPDLRKALPKHAAHKLEDQGDFDIDAFFASVTDEDVPSAATHTVPLPTIAPKAVPVSASTQVVPVVPMPSTPATPSGRPPPLPRAASQGGAPPPLPPGAKRAPSQAEKTQLITPVPIAKPGVSATPLFGTSAKGPLPGIARPGTDGQRATGSQPALDKDAPHDTTQPVAVAPPPRSPSGIPSLPGQRPSGGIPSVPGRTTGGQPAPTTGEATQVVPVVPMPQRPSQPSVPAPPQRPSQPNIPSPAQRPSGGIPAVPKPTGGLPSQQSRPNPIAPGSAAGRQPIPVATVGGRAPEKPEPLAQKPPPGMNDADVNALYAKYVKAKEMVGEQAGPGAYGKLLKTINAQAPKIMEQYKAKGVEFSVVVKDNQVIIKAKPKT